MSESAIVEWFSRNGAQVHPSIRISQSESGEYVLTSVDVIPESTTIISIPSSSILSTANSPFLQRAPAIAEKAQWPALIMTIIWEASQPDSKWRAYLDTLPKEFDTLMYWNADELKDLEGSAVVNKIGKEEAEMWYATDFSDFRDKHREVFEGVDTSLEAFHRVGSWVTAFSADLAKPVDESNPRDEDDMEDDDDNEYDSLDSFKAMVPFSNLIPSDCDEANCEFSPSESAISFVAIKDIPANTALYVDPGPLPRSDLLRRVGSYPQSSAQHDVIEIDSTLIISVAGSALLESVRDERIEKLVDEDILEDSYDIEADGSIPSEILIVIQAFMADDQTFQSYVEQEKFPKAKKDPRTGNIILEVIAKRREMYTTTVEEDIALLRSGAELSKRKRMAVEVRAGEKEILRRMENTVRSWGVEIAEGSGGRDRKRLKR
ncbi:hypothetical protein H072_8656 [Dactylellina haptotyla CBS 200.50]|uniref:SET domain-containing protein n=1 Tax=Dactylellina haptotyla (strain CBS 200.50) TaxID=1284197 RepID=S8A967_DACHA|nr:hypothetical protein H072_8656 [Dactylellina haptotyla CBS 200.50]